VNENTIKLFQSRNTDSWETPKYLYEELDQEFHFDLDPCPLEPKYNGLEIDWVGSIFVNPPYSQVYKWLEKAHLELNKGNATTIVFLVFTNTDTKWFHNLVYNKAELRFLKGRLKFKGKNKKGEPASNSAMRPSMLVIFRKEKKLNSSNQNTTNSEVN